MLFNAGNGYEMNSVNHFVNHLLERVRLLVLVTSCNSVLSDYCSFYDFHVQLTHSFIYI